MTKVVGVAPTAPIKPMRSSKKGTRHAMRHVEATYATRMSCLRTVGPMKRRTRPIGPGLGGSGSRESAGAAGCAMPSSSVSTRSKIGKE